MNDTPLLVSINDGKLIVDVKEIIQCSTKNYSDYGLMNILFRNGKKVTIKYHNILDRMMEKDMGKIVGAKRTIKL